VSEKLCKSKLQSVFRCDNRSQFCSQHFGMVAMVISSSDLTIWLTYDLRCHEKPHRTHHAHRARCAHRARHETLHRTNRNTASTPHRMHHAHRHITSRSRSGAWRTV